MQKELLVHGAEHAVLGCSAVLQPALGVTQLLDVQNYIGYEAMINLFPVCCEINWVTQQEGVANSQKVAGVEQL